MVVVSNAVSSSRPNAVKAACKITYTWLLQCTQNLRVISALVSNNGAEGNCGCERASMECSPSFTGGVIVAQCWRLNFATFPLFHGDTLVALVTVVVNLHELLQPRRYLCLLGGYAMISLLSMLQLPGDAKVCGAWVKHTEASRENIIATFWAELLIISWIPHHWLPLTSFTSFRHFQHPRRVLCMLRRILTRWKSFKMASSLYSATVLHSNPARSTKMGYFWAESGGNVGGRASESLSQDWS